jgi:hypothetical protein
MLAYLPITHNAYQDSCRQSSLHFLLQYPVGIFYGNVALEFASQ